MKVIAWEHVENRYEAYFPFGLIDSRGRTVGCVAHLWPSEDGKTYITRYCSAREGQVFGSADSRVVAFSNAEEVAKYYEKEMEKYKKRLLRTSEDGVYYTACEWKNRKETK